MPNITGKAYAMNVITPMKRYRTIFLRVIFFGVGVLTFLQAGLKRLSFIHFARWVIIHRNSFPYLGAPQEPEHLRYDYLLFCSNFNGTWNQYIDSFSAGIPSGLDRIWSGSVHFPMSVPITPFKRYIQHNQIGTNYYYSAYPGSTTSDVKAAQRVNTALERFAKETDTLSVGEFEAAYRKLLTQVQKDLGSTGGPGPVGT